MMKVVRTAGKKPILSLSLIIDAVCTLGYLSLGITLLVSLPPPFPETHLEVVRERLDAVWWSMLAGGVLLLLGSVACLSCLMYSVSLLFPETVLTRPLVAFKRWIITEYMSQMCATQEEAGRNVQPPAVRLEVITSNLKK